MTKRLLSTVALWILLVLLLRMTGPDGAVWLLAAIGLLTQHELYRILERMGQKPFRKIGLVLGAALIVAPHYARVFARGSAEAALAIETGLIALVIVVCCVRILWEREPVARFAALSSTLFGLLFVPFMFTFFVRVFWLYGPPSRDALAGITAAVWIIAAAKCCDAGAYLWGSLLGRHQMCPRISPKKTWEGAAGGLATSAGVAAALAAFLPSSVLPPTLTPGLAAILALPIAAAAIVSDLVESVLKRAAEMKDSGSAIPGIGGAFDLTDSLVLAAPVGYVLLLAFT